jgi:hypothetical protein
MSRSKRSPVDVVESIYEAVGDGDLDRIEAALAEDVEWGEPAGGTYGGTYHAPDEVIANLFAELSDEWDEFSVEPKRFVVDGGTVVALVTHRGVHAETGERFAAPNADVWDLQGRKVTKFQHFVGSIRYVESRTEE